jgi:protein TonB
VAEPILQLFEVVPVAPDDVPTTPYVPSVPVALTPVDAEQVAVHAIPSVLFDPLPPVESPLTFIVPFPVSEYADIVTAAPPDPPAPPPPPPPPAVTVAKATDFVLSQFVLCFP